MAAHATHAPHEREATPEHLADGGRMVMGSPLRPRAQRDVMKQTLLYAIPIVVVLAAGAYFVLGQNGAGEPGTAANPISAGFSAEPLPPQGTTPAGQTNLAIAPSVAPPVGAKPVAARAHPAPAPAAAQPVAPTAADQATDASARAPDQPAAASAAAAPAIAPQPPEKLNQSVNAAPAEVQPVPATPNPAAPPDAAGLGAAAD